VRNALARFGQTYFESQPAAQAAWENVLRAAKRFGIEHERSMPAVKVKREERGARSRKERSSTLAAFVSSCAVAITAEEAPEWIELLPAGRFAAVDGRGPFLNDNPEQIVTASIAKMPPAGLVLDYDHSTDLAAPEGRPAPAAGWLKGLKVQDSAIFARVEWTQEAAAAIKAKKYRYVSPVFEHSKDGRVERILRAALTNNPALISLPAIAAANGPINRVPLARRAEQGPSLRRRSAAVLHLTGGERGEEQAMAKKELEAAEGGEKSLSEIVAGLEDLFPEMSHKQILEMAMSALDDDDDYDSGSRADEMGSTGGTPAPQDDPYQHEDAERMAQRHTQEMARCTSDGERAEVERRHEIEKERFARRIRGLEVQNRNEKMTAKELDARVAKHPMVVQMASDLNQMRQTQAKASATEKVDAAIREGRLVPSQRDWAVEYCSADPTGFLKFIGAQPQILQNGADGTFSGRIGETPADAPTQKELAVCEHLGVSVEKFVAAKKARLSHNVHLD
jgi:phage I-like protein